MKKIFTPFFFTVISTALWAQVEICDNGIDDDNDGFIDCYDPDCASSATSINSEACDGFYLGNDVLCEVVPAEFPEFTMELDFASPDETTNHIGRMSIGDIDRDGIPEIVTMNRYTNKLIILNGNDGSVKTSLDVPFTPLWEIALGNLNNDNCAELFFQGLEDDGEELYIYAYDCNLNQLWKTKIWEGNGNAMDALMYGLADFDGDGLVELYVKDMILDAHTGTIIIGSSATSNNTWTGLNGGPTAVDVMGDDDLELVLGCTIYSVNLGTRTANSGTRTQLKTLPEYNVKYYYNATSVADYNLDGYLDIIASGGEEINGRLYTTIFFWDVQNDTYKTFSDPIDGTFYIDGCPPESGSYYRRGWVNGTGRVNIGDLDGDERLDVSYVSGKYLYALDENLELLWRIEINEETSGFTGCTLFDFNGDGQSEIVYRDERFLYIINGVNGTIYSQQACISRTQREYPIVADVDADGSTELCVTCGFDNIASSNNFCDLKYSRYSHVRVFKSAAEPWVPARRLWNQHGYFNVNVNDDLTIPRRQQKHHKVWSTGNCTNGPNRPLNNFLNQSPFLNSQGCPTYAAPDIAMVDGSLDINDPTCPQTNFTISFNYTNVGDVSISGPMPVTFYKGNPFADGSERLNTVTITLSGLAPGDTLSASNVTVNGDGSAFQLWVVLNDPGTSVLPLTMPIPGAPIIECPNDNNTGFGDVNPLPVPITALKVQDNIKCILTTPDNGAVRAFVAISGGGENIADYNFYWAIGATAKSAPADYVGAAYNNRPEGPYTVYAVHKTAQCNSDTATVTVDRIDNSITVDIQLTNVDNCQTPNGQLTAIVNGGAPVNNYTYEWFEGNDINGVQIGISEVVSNLAPGTYTVEVTDKVTGCPTVGSETVTDQTVKPVVSTTKVDLLCSTANSGSVSATVGGVTAGYTFKWYNGNSVKPSPDFTGDTYSSRPAGNYTVVATNNTSQCDSDPVTVNLMQTTPPVVSASTVADQTSCDAAQPNGSATANVGGVTAGFTFEWFTGQNTLPVNLIASTSSISGRSTGVYTVKATSIATGCSGTAEVTIANSVVTPAIIVGAVGNSTNCTTPNGSVTVNVSLDAPSDYTFFWYNGTAVKASTDYPDTDNVLEGLTPGSYTVRAVHNTKFCAAAPVTAVVGDDAPPISIVLDDLVTILPTDCNQNNGTMVINISAPGNVNGFAVEWYTGIAPPAGAPFRQESGVTTSTAPNLNAGIYTIIATNLDNGCQNTEEITLPFANAQELTFISKNDIDNCNLDDGQIEVELTPTQVPFVFSEADYELHVYAGGSDLGMPLSSPTGTDLIEVIDGVHLQSNYSTNNNLAPGYYTLVAISKNPATLGCRSVPVTAEVELLTANPVITGPPVNANTNCAGTTANGEIELTINGGDAPANYTFEWFEGPDVSSDPLGTNTSGTTNADGNIASNLAPGTYTVRVTDDVPASEGCMSTATYVILDNPPVVFVGTGDVTVDHITSCDPADNGSEITISNIRENGSPVPLVNYTFEWFDSGMASLGISTNTASNLGAGTYFIRGTNTVNNCATTLLQFDIQDMTPGVGVDLVSFVNPTRCLKPTNVTGELIVNATGNSATGYTYNWYAGSTVSGPVVFNAAGFTGITPPDLTYTVEVINNENLCRVTDTYSLELIDIPVRLSATTSPVTFCDTDNGSVFAIVTTGNSGEYDYVWSTGNTPLPPPAQQKDNLAAGDYTIVAIDQLDATCQTDPLTVSIGTDRVMPVVTATPRTPVTNCSPAVPNGSASASVGGDIVNYSFEWFEGPVATGTPVFTGSDAGSLPAMEYTVQATHLVTGCSATAQLTINYSPVAIAPVDIEVLAHQTSCDAPNGALTASVNGNTIDYIFDWSMGDTPKATPDFTGVIWTGLDAGRYTVVATHKVTGCQSAPDTDEIIEELSYPDFDFVVVNSGCPEDANGDDVPDDNPSGFVTLILNNDVTIASIKWLVNGDTVVGPRLGGVGPGVYTAIITSTLGCVATKDVLVKSEIRPYNGISRNGDEINRIFHINCIGDFPSNIVQIFNRAGTLVYEAEGYDNIDIFFDGISNKGIAVMGNNLPDGTYFYVINKRDGSKPLAGYLEIVN